ncbi:MAG TPA: hypothetical protein VNJ31_05865 [Methyloceanibacter sp.]|nr:hypothetical protein [Methyloceanibacter sp.]
MIPTAAGQGATKPDDDEIARRHDGDNLLVMAEETMGVIQSDRRFK